MDLAGEVEEGEKAEEDVDRGYEGEDERHSRDGERVRRGGKVYPAGACRRLRRIGRPFLILQILAHSVLSYDRRKSLDPKVMMRIAPLGASKPGVQQRKTASSHAHNTQRRSEDGDDGL